MPLIDFKTDLKSLRYGSDKPNGGSSVQPYINYPIPDTPNQPFSNNQLAFFDSYYETNRTSLDFPIRGGRILQGAGGVYATPSNEIDRIRILNFLKDAPRGKIFIQKQVGLQLTNPNTQVPDTLQFVGLSLNNQVLPTTRTYNPLNTIAQVATQGTGIHFNRHGVVPTLYESLRTTYQYIAANTNTPTENRLLLLSTIKLRESNGYQFVAEDIVGLNAVNRLGISPAQSQILNYQGGPGSVYGIGSTIIKRATSTIPAKAYSKIALTYQQIAEQNTRQDTDNPLIAQVQDFRGFLRDSQGSSEVAWGDYEKYSSEKNFQIGNPGTNVYPRITYNSVIAPAIDELNRSSPFYYNAATQTPWDANGNMKDMIKFAFECMSNDYPGDAVGLVFRAFLDGSIQDSNTAAYNSFKYLGRGETFRVYQGFDRNISFAFKILVQTRSEMQPLYRKLNHLISQVYPDYSPAQSFMRGSVVKLTIGDYLYRVPGFLDSVNVTLGTDVGWEILLGQYDESDVAQLPFVVDVNCTFKPILNILPRRETYEQPFVPLIVNTPNNFLDTPITNPGTAVTNRDTVTATQQAQAEANANAAKQPIAVPATTTNTAPATTSNTVVAEKAANKKGTPPAKKPKDQGNDPFKYVRPLPKNNGTAGTLPGGLGLFNGA